MTTRFQPSAPALIPDEEALDRAVPLAIAAGLRVSLAVYPYPPSQFEQPAVAAGFAAS